MLLLGVFSACSSSFLSRGSSSSSYEADLSDFRTRYPYTDEEILVTEAPKEAKQPGAEKASEANPESELAVDKELSAILQTINQQNRAVRYMPGFRIQIYVGNIRSEADGAKAFVYRNFPEMSPYITFSQPTYRVKVGDFINKSEAEQILSSVKLQYPTAVIIADKIEIEKGLLQAIAD